MRRRERAEAEQTGRMIDLTGEDRSGEGESVEEAAAAGRNAMALVLRFERDQLIRAAVEEGLKLYKSRRAQAQKREDRGAWLRGREDAARLSTGRALGGA